MPDRSAPLTDEQMQLLCDALDGDARALSRVETEGLCNELEQMRSTEGRLRALYAPGDHIPALDGAPAPRTPMRGLRLAASIALIVGALGAVWYSQAVVNAPPAFDASALHLAYLRNDRVAHVCDTPEKFLQYTRDALEEPIGARFDTDVQLVGWRGTGSGYQLRQGDPRVLLARSAGGDEVVVLFQQRTRRAPTIGDVDGLKIYERRFGSIEAYEISTLDDPVVLPLLSDER